MPDPYPRPDMLPEFDEPRRISALAVSSLVFGVLCCIPVAGVVAIILGVAALIRMRDADRVGGRGLAFTGIALGLLTSFLQVGVAVGVAQSLSVFHAYGNMVGDLQAGNTAKVRAMLISATDSRVTDERLAEVGAQIEGEWGTFQSMPRGLGEWLGVFADLQRAVNAAGVAAPGGSHVPLPLTFDRGQTVGVFTIDPNSPSQGGLPRVVNFGVVDQSGRLIWLLDPTATRAPPASPVPGTPDAGAPPPEPSEAPPPGDAPPGP